MGQELNRQILIQNRTKKCKKKNYINYFATKTYI